MNIIKSNEVNSNIGYYRMMLMESDESFKYYYGPLLLSRGDGNIKLCYLDNPYEKMIHDIKSLIQNLQNPKLTYGELKKYIRSEIAKLGFVENIYTCKMRTIYSNIIEELKNQQRESSLLEGALIATSPIVSYQESISPDKVDKETNTIKASVSLLDHIIENDNMKEVLENLLIDNVFNITMNAESYIFNNELSSDNIISSDVDLLVEDSILNKDKVNYPLIYNFLAYLNYNHKPEDFKNIKDYLLDIVKNLGNFPYDGISDTKDLIFKLENLSIKKDCDRLFSMENVNTLQFYHDKKMEEIYNNATNNGEESKNEMDKKYNIDILLSYIYTNRQYKYDNYTNYIFTNKFNVVGDMSYITDTNIMICEIDDKYLAAPVIDLADNYKLKLVKLDRDGNITTEVI